jgi:PAS domain S-box-containing protein
LANAPDVTLAANSQPVDLSTDQSFFSLLTESYARLVGKPLVPFEKDALWLYRDAPFVMLAHNTDTDPHFIYANKAAQACFGYSLDEFLSLPSRLSAEPEEQTERQELLDRVRRNGYMSGYRGVRIAKSGQRFIIEDGVVWELIDEHGAHHGQAAAFSTWRDI